MNSNSFFVGPPASSVGSRLKGGGGAKKGLLIASGVLFGVGVILLIVMLAVKSPAPPSEPAAGARPRSARSRVSLEADSEKEARDALSSPGAAIVFLYADWCGHCKRADPIFAKLAESPEFKHIKMLKLNSTRATALARERGVRGFPTFLTTWGEGKYTGFMPEDKMRAVLASAAAAPGGARRGVRISKHGGATESEEEVMAALAGPMPAVVFMSMQGCGFCQKQQPLWDAAASSGKFNHVKMLQIDGKHARKLAAAHGVTGFPTMLSNRGAKKYVGFKRSPQFEEMLIEIGKA
jgi:thiol-disulfide isomerase/thioredoxin